MKSFYASVLVLACALIFSTPGQAQMPTDVIYMPKKTVCVAGVYSYSTWTQYWEGTRQRENQNIGTHTTQSVSVMPAIGITNRLNLILNLPYVRTSTSAGNLMGQQGVQDLSAWLKLKALEYKGFSVNLLAGGGLPIGNYVPDFLPMSIGLQSRTATGRLLLNYTHPKTGLYVTTYGSYTWRSNIKVDRDAHFTNGQLWNTNEMQIPNMYDASVRVGVSHREWQAEAFVERMAGLSGDDIRRNDMPYPTNNMQATQIGGYGKFQPRNLGLNARVAYVTDGRNVGQSTSFMLGVLYQFSVN